MPLAGDRRAEDGSFGVGAHPRSGEGALRGCLDVLGVRTSLRIALLACACGAAWSGVARAATYYVSPAGSDGAAGTSPAAAWKTVAKVNGKNLKPGDRVLFKGGGVWNDMLEPRGNGTAAAPIAFAGYGSGRPVLDGRRRALRGLRRHLARPRLRVLHGLRAAQLARPARLPHGQHRRALHRHLRPPLRRGHPPHAVSVRARAASSRAAASRRSAGARRAPPSTCRRAPPTGSCATRASPARRTAASSTRARARSTCACRSAAAASAATPTGRTACTSRAPARASSTARSRRSLDSCISVRFQDAVVSGNRVHGCLEGISWYEYATAQGTVRLTRNRIWDTGTGIYLDGSTTQNFLLGQQHDPGRPRDRRRDAWASRCASRAASRSRTPS